MPGGFLHCYEMFLPKAVRGSETLWSWDSCLCISNILLFCCSLWVLGEHFSTPLSIYFLLLLPLWVSSFHLQILQYLPFSKDKTARKPSLKWKLADSISNKWHYLAKCSQSCTDQYFCLRKDQMKGVAQRIITNLVVCLSSIQNLNMFISFIGLYCPQMHFFTIKADSCRQWNPPVYSLLSREPMTGKIRN